MSGLQTHAAYKTTQISEQNVGQFSVTVSQITINLATHAYYLTDTVSYKSGQITCLHSSCRPRLECHLRLDWGRRQFQAH